MCGCPALILLGYKPAVVPLAVLALLALAAALYLPALYAPLLRRRYMPGAFVGRREAAFYPEGFTFRGAQTSLSVRYTAVRRVTETEHLYLITLATGQTLYLRRDGLTAGAAEAFSAFLAERTGRAVRRRRGTLPAVRVRVLAFAAAACFLLASCALAVVWMRRPTMYWAAEYGMQLTAEFVRRPLTDEQTLFSAYSDEVEVSVHRYPLWEVQAQLGTKADSLERLVDKEIAYAARTYGSFFLTDGPFFLANGAGMFCYLCAATGGTAGCCEVILVQDGQFYLTEFVCDAGALGSLTDTLYRWAASIQLR